MLLFETGRKKNYEKVLRGRYHGCKSSGQLNFSPLENLLGLRITTLVGTGPGSLALPGNFKTGFSEPGPEPRVPGIFQNQALCWPRSRIYGPGRPLILIIYQTKFSYSVRKVFYESRFRLGRKNIPFNFFVENELVNEGKIRIKTSLIQLKRKP